MLLKGAGFNIEGELKNKLRSTINILINILWLNYYFNYNMYYTLRSKKQFVLITRIALDVYELFNFVGSFYGLFILLILSNVVFVITFT